MLNAGGRPSALASVAARAVGAASPTVSFEVVHVGSDQGRFERGRPVDVKFVSGSADEGSISREFLCFEVPGARFGVRTWSPREPRAVPAGTSVEKTDGNRGSVANSWRGSIALNPNFLYDSARSTEMLLTLNREAWAPDYADTLMVAFVADVIASIVAETAKAPVIFLQSPVAPYDPTLLRDGRCSDDRPRPARALAIRFAIGVDESSAAQRLKIVTDISTLATEFGMGLQVADRRLGRVRGEWWTVSEPEDSVYEHLKSKLFDWRPEDVPTSAWLLTFVGPARVGSLVEIMRYLFPRNAFGILAIAVSTLQEIAFINVVVAAAPTATGNFRIDRAEHAPGEPSRIVRDGDATQLRGGLHELDDSDYVLLSTGPVLLSMIHAADIAEFPLWVSWELVPVPTSNPEVVELILKHLRNEPVKIKDTLKSRDYSDVGVEYYRARLLDDGRVRGRAKIYVRLSEVEERDVPRILDELCVRAQKGTMSDLIKVGLRRDTFRIKLAWRETWLGWSPGVV